MKWIVDCVAVSFPKKILRVPDEVAAEKVQSGQWRYIRKTEWKKCLVYSGIKDSEEKEELQYTKSMGI